MAHLGLRKKRRNPFKHNPWRLRSKDPKNVVADNAGLPRPPKHGLVCQRSGRLCNSGFKRRG
jgi:hypothetical protein